MPYQTSSCDCTSNNVSGPVQCKGCGNGSKDEEAEQRRIWNVSRAAASLYVMNKGVQNVTGGTMNDPLAAFGFVNWNQASDRNRAGVSTYHTSRQTTRCRPGGNGAGGVGVDIKHNSYNRYLARKKSGNLKTKKENPLPQPKKGNKQYVLGFIKNCNC
tara:strand:+ start:3173 stop:3646 length:474 start_codon:yes stop_codon:yes gene_type:complete